MNPNEVSKTLMESAAVGHGDDLFLIIFSSGKEQHGFVALPKGAKAFYENLGKHIKEFEAKHGPIDTTGLDLGTLSPFQKQS